MKVYILIQCFDDCGERWEEIVSVYQNKADADNEKKNLLSDRDAILATPCPVKNVNEYDTEDWLKLSDAEYWQVSNWYMKWDDASAIRDYIIKEFELI